MTRSVSYETHTPREAAEKIGEAAEKMGGIFKGDHNRYFREKVSRGYKRMAALCELARDGIKFEEGRDATVDEIIWNANLNAELVKIAEEETDINLTETIIDCFLLSLSENMPVSTFWNSDLDNMLQKYVEERDHHKKLEIVSQSAGNKND